MTAQEAYEASVKARLDGVIEFITKATGAGLFEMRIEKLTPDQVQYLKDNNFKVREIQQKGGSTFDINWEQ